MLNQVAVPIYYCYCTAYLLFPVLEGVLTALGVYLCRGLSSVILLPNLSSANMGLWLDRSLNSFLIPALSWVSIEYRYSPVGHLEPMMSHTVQFNFHRGGGRLRGRIQLLT